MKSVRRHSTAVNMVKKASQIKTYVTRGTTYAVL